MRDFQSLCQERRSYRKYTDQPVEQEKLDYIMRCALMSPAGKRMNPWRFVVITNQEILRQLAGCRTYGSGMFDTAMAGIVVAADTSVIDTWQCDAAIAAQNIWLAAADQGLGACWCGVYVQDNVVNNVKEILGLEDRYVPFSLIHVGYPDEEKKANSGYDEKKVEFYK